jgi:hypothetical protein
MCRLSSTSGENLDLHYREVSGIVVVTRKSKASITIDIDWELRRHENLRANGVKPKLCTCGKHVSKPVWDDE